ncbi:MAG: FG-GAP repeat protein [Myxococcota bacterium]
MPVEAAAAGWIGENPGDFFGVTVAAADLDGDGADELLADAMAWPGGGFAGAERRGRLYGLTLDTPTLADAGLVIDGDPGYQHLGQAVAAGDFDGDDIPDLAVSSPSQRGLDPTLPGRVLVWFGPVSGHHTAADADLSYAGERPGDNAGYTLAAADVDADGTDDLVVGAPFSDEVARDAGEVYLLAGPLGR